MITLPGPPQKKISDHQSFILKMHSGNGAALANGCNLSYFNTRPDYNPGRVKYKETRTDLSSMRNLSSCQNMGNKLYTPGSEKKSFLAEIF